MASAGHAASTQMQLHFVPHFVQGIFPYRRYDLNNPITKLLKTQTCRPCFVTRCKNGIQNEMESDMTRAFLLSFT